MNFEGMELVPSETLNPAKIFFDGGMDEILKGIRAKLDEAIQESQWNPEVESDRTKMKSLAYKVSRSKTLLKKLYDEQIADAKSKIAKAQKIWKPAEATLDKWRDETKAPAVEYEAEQAKLEEKRKSKIQGNIEHLKEFRIWDPRLTTVEEIENVIKSVEDWKIEPDEYFEFTVEANKIKTELIIENSKILNMRKALDKEEAERKAEAEKLAAERAELDRLRKEQEKKDRVEKEKRESEAAKLRAEQEAIEAEKRKLSEEKAALERAEFERKAKEEARIKAEQEAKERAEREAKEKIEREKAEVAEKERQEKLKPDKEKLEAFAQFLAEGMTFPDVNSEEAKNILEETSSYLRDIADEILSKIKDM